MAKRLSDRISSHNEPSYILAEPNLHYHAWDSAEDMESKFVTLTGQSLTASKDDRFVLKFQEMRMTCIFQIITVKHPTRYLHARVNKAWVGRHLIIVLPISQWFSGNLSALKEAIGETAAFGDFLGSPDLITRDWAWDLRHSFNDLRNPFDTTHPSLLLLQRHASKSQAGKRGVWKEKIPVYAAYLSRRYITDCFWWRRHAEGTPHKLQWLFIRHISATATGSPGGGQSKIAVLSYRNTNLQVYATKALAIDPASRLAVSIEGQGAYGSYHVWPRNRSEKCVKMNTLVDVLEGVSLKESKGMARRWFVKRRQGTFKKDVVHTARNDEL